MCQTDFFKIFVASFSPGDTLSLTAGSLLILKKNFKCFAFDS